eukprot:jgi/Tetstr1/443616/TSEL_031615.t1
MPVRGDAKGGSAPAERGVQGDKPPTWKYVERVKESHGEPIYCVAYNFIDLRHKNVFATVGKNQATVYRCEPDSELEVLQVYLDPDAEEFFYTCTWSRDDASGAALLLVAGHCGRVRVIDTNRGQVVHTFTGHGNAINDCKVHPVEANLFLTASKDESLRLWNLKTKTCVLVFHGDGGHRNEVLSIDFHPLRPGLFASCGMDNTVKVWSYADFRSVVEDSHTWEGEPSRFTTRYVQYPIFSSSKVHGNYVDCIRWLGDLVLSKSVDNRILLWGVDLKHSQKNKNSLESVDFLQEYPLEDADIWFLRFSMDYHCEVMAAGNRLGKVFVYNVGDVACLQRLERATLKSPVRQTAVSFDGTTVLCCCEDATVHRWDAS